MIYELSDLTRTIMNLGFSLIGIYFAHTFQKVKTKAMAMYLHVASGVFILHHSRCIPGCLLF